MKKSNTIIFSFFILINIILLFIPIEEKFFYFSAFNYSKDFMSYAPYFYFCQVAFIVIMLLILLTSILFYKTKKEFWAIIPTFAHLASGLIVEILSKKAIEFWFISEGITNYPNIPIISQYSYHFIISLFFSLLGIIMLMNVKFQFL